MPAGNQKEYARLYFDVELEFPGPYRGEEAHGNEVHALEQLLNENGLDASCIDQRRIRKGGMAYRAKLAVAALHEFAASSIHYPKKNVAGFNIKPKALDKARLATLSKIGELLVPHGATVNARYRDAASRHFDFQVQLAGSLELEYKLTKADIAEADGSVRDAIAYFNDKVEEVVNSSGERYVVSPQSTRQRPSDNIFRFDLNVEVIYSFPENTVFGELALMRKNLPLDQAEVVGVDCQDQVLLDYIASTRDELESACMLDLPDKVKIRHLSLEFVDYYEDLLDYSDELL